nr:IS200/IS605 family transposase [Anaerobutyricum soehngenii]
MYNKASYATIVKVSQANTKENRRRSNVDSSSLSHTRYKCQYHIVFIPKYRKRIMYGRLKAGVREIIKKLCDYRNIEIVEGTVCADHVHLCLSISPSEKVSDVVGYIKGIMIHDKYPESVNGWSKVF